MNDILLAFLITFIIASPEITITDSLGRIRFHLEGFICKMVRTIKLQYLIDEASILMEKNNQTIKVLKEMESKKDEKQSDS